MIFYERAIREGMKEYAPYPQPEFVYEQEQEREPSEWLRERIREQIREQMRKQMEEQVREHIPEDIKEAIDQLREAGWLPRQLVEAGRLPEEYLYKPLSEQLRAVGRVMEEQRQGGFGWVREFFSDIGFLVIFLVFVLLAGVYLGQRTLFYILSLILLSIIIVNADKFRRMIELLKGVVT